MEPATQADEHATENINPTTGLISVVRRAQYLASMKASDDVVRKENVDRDEYVSVHTLISA